MRKVMAQRKKRALLVGVNDYEKCGDLKGCVNDVANMRAILKTYFGFENMDIRVLVDDRATKENVLHRLKRMVEASKPGDVLFFHFSGHGSQIRDRDGDEELVDQLDELLCPYDMDWYKGTFILDDELQHLFQGLDAQAHLEGVIDTCHSGNIFRLAELERPAELGPEHPRLSRFLRPPLDLEARYEGEEDRLQKRHFSDLLTGRSNRILWSACEDWQTSADAYIPEKESYNGAFTYYLCKHIRSTGAKIAREDLLRRVCATLRYKRFDQVPQLEYDATQKKSVLGAELLV